MTAKRDLKKLIRDRMKKTGESYASAGESSAPILGWIATGEAPHDYEFKLDERGHQNSSSAMVRARKEKPDGFGGLIGAPLARQPRNLDFTEGARPVDDLCDRLRRDSRPRQLRSTTETSR